MTIGEKIKIARKKLKLSRLELGEKIGRSEYTIKKYEIGQVVPSVEIIEQLSRELGISVLDLIEDSYGPGHYVKDLMRAYNIDKGEIASVLDISCDVMDEYLEDIKPIPLEVLIKISIYIDIPLMFFVHQTDYDEHKLLGKDFPYSGVIRTVQDLDESKIEEMDKGLYQKLADFIDRNEKEITAARYKWKMDALPRIVSNLGRIYSYIECVEEVSDDVLLEIVQSEDIKHLLAYVYEKFNNKRDFSKIKRVSRVQTRGTKFKGIE